MHVPYLDLRVSDLPVFVRGFTGPIYFISEPTTGTVVVFFFDLFRLHWELEAVWGLHVVGFCGVSVSGWSGN